MLFELLFILTTASIMLVIYHHVGYPIVLKLARKRRSESLPYYHTPHYEPGENDEQFPEITIVMPAYNEAEYVQEKIRNLACQDYPAHKLKVILACDGCTDNTASLARLAWQEDICKHLQLEIKEFEINRGKIAVINEVIPTIESPLVALTDVSSLVSIDALSIAAVRFENPEVSAVNGNYRLLNPGSMGESVYWRYQSQIKIGEEALGSVLGAHGAFYLLRTKLFKPLDKGTINDDFILPMRTIEDGYRVVYEPRLNALELEQSDQSLDWRRRLRISAGNAQQLAQLHRLLHPKYRGIALAFFSGKGLRVVMPFLMLMSLFGSVALAYYQSFFLLLALGQSAIYIIALWVHLVKPKKAGKLAKTIHYLVSGHTAGLIGCLRYLSSKTTVKW